MLISILNIKYPCGSERGIKDFKYPGILDILNELIDFENSTWPTKNFLSQEIDKTILGDTPKLKPGDCFLFKGQVIAIDGPDRLILTTSETGALALDRIFKEIIEPEYRIHNLYKNIETIKIDFLDTDIPGNLTHTQLPQYLRNFDFILHTSTNLKTIIDSLKLAITIDTADYIMPVTIYLDKDNYYWDNVNEIFFEDAATMILDNIASWLFKNVKTVVDQAANILTKRLEKIKKQDEENHLNCFSPSLEDSYLTKDDGTILERNVDTEEAWEGFEQKLEFSKKFQKIVEKAKQSEKAVLEYDNLQLVIQHPDSTHLTDFWELGEPLLKDEISQDDWGDFVLYLIPNDIIDLSNTSLQEEFLDFTGGCFSITQEDSLSDLLTLLLDNNSISSEQLQKKVEDYIDQLEKDNKICGYFSTDFD